MWPPPTLTSYTTVRWSWFLECRQCQQTATIHPDDHEYKPRVKVDTVLNLYDEWTKEFCR